jgi:hypothetical protein
MPSTIRVTSIAKLEICLEKNRAVVKKAVLFAEMTVNLWVSAQTTQGIKAEVTDVFSKSSGKYSVEIDLHCLRSKTYGGSPKSENSAPMTTQTHHTKPGLPLARYSGVWVARRERLLWLAVLESNLRWPIYKPMM